MSEVTFEDLAGNFEFDQLVVHIRKVNPRVEIHGENEKLAVDVSCRLTMGEVGDEWDAVLAMLIGPSAPGDPTVEDVLEVVKGCTKTWSFSREFETYRANFSVVGKMIGTLGFCKVNGFTMDFDDIGIVFRVQALADGDTIGHLSEWIGKKMCLQTIRVESPDPAPKVEVQSEMDIPKQVTKRGRGRPRKQNVPRDNIEEPANAPA